MAETLMEMLAQRVYPPAWQGMTSTLREKLQTISEGMSTALFASPAELRTELLTKVRDEVLRHLVQPEVGLGYVKLPVDPKLKQWAIDTTDIAQVEADLREVREKGGCTIDDLLRDIDRELGGEQL